MNRWPEEKENRLRELWGSGLSASEVAAELGPDVTRNAVSGKVGRLGLQERQIAARAEAPSPSMRAAALISPPRRPDDPHLPKAQRGAARAERHNAFNYSKLEALKKLAAESPEPAREDDAIMIPLSQRVTLMELRPASCRWPIGSPASDRFRFCGGRATGAWPYCSYHAGIAYRPPRERVAFRSKGA